MNKKVTEVSDCCVCVQFQSVIKAVVEEVDDALQLLHSQVYLSLYTVFVMQSLLLPIFITFDIFFHFTVLQLKRTIVSVALWDGESDSFHNK